MKTKHFDFTRDNSGMVIMALRPKNERKKFFLLRRAFKHTGSAFERLKKMSRSCVFPILTGVKWEEFNQGRENR